MRLISKKEKGTKNYPQGHVGLYSTTKNTQSGMAKYVVKVKYYDKYLRNIYFLNKTDAVNYYQKLSKTGMNDIKWRVNMNISTKGDVVYFNKRYHPITKYQSKNKSGINHKKRFEKILKDPQKWKMELVKKGYH